MRCVVLWLVVPELRTTCLCLAPCVQWYMGSNEMLSDGFTEMLSIDQNQLISDEYTWKYFVNF